MYYLYGLIDSSTNEIYYYGMTNNPRKRFFEHLNNRGRIAEEFSKTSIIPTKTNQLIANGKVVKMKIIDKSTNELFIAKKEMYLINKHYSTITNVYNELDSKLNQRQPGKNNFGIGAILSSKEFEFEFYTYTYKDNKPFRTYNVKMKYPEKQYSSRPKTVYDRKTGILYPSLKVFMETTGLSREYIAKNKKRFKVKGAKNKQKK